MVVILSFVPVCASVDLGLAYYTQRDPSWGPDTITCFTAYPKTSFITTQLRGSIYQSLSKLLHMLGTMIISGLRIQHQH